MGGHSLARALMALALCGSTMAMKTWFVTEGSDTPSGFCNGNHCDLRGAWHQALVYGQDAQILLQVDVTLDNTLTANSFSQNLRIMNDASRNASYSVMAANSEGNTQETFRFLYVYSTSVEVSLTLAGLRISGFRPGTDNSHGTDVHGGAVYFGAGQINTAEERANFIPKPSLNLAHVMTIERCVFANNGVHHDNRDHHRIGGGALTVDGCSNNPCMVHIDQTSFVGNVLYDALAAEGTAIWLSDQVSANITGSTFTKNHFSGCVAASGTIYFFAGNVHLTNTHFIANHGSNEGGVAIYGGNKNYPENSGNLYATGSTFIRNNPGRIEQGKSPSVVASNHMHLISCQFINSDGHLQVTESYDDQYIDSTSFTDSDGTEASISGFAFYNRNPINAGNLRAIGGPIGGNTPLVATCSGAQQWWPCPAGTSCSEVQNNDGQNIGYNCQ